MQLSDILGDIPFFAQFAEHKFADYTLKLISLQYSDKSMFRYVSTAIQFPKIDSNYYITKHHAQIDRSYNLKLTIFKIKSAFNQ